MKIRNAMCICALFSIIALFFCFGVVANAAESGETVSQTYSYNLSYDLRGMKVGNYKNTKFTIDGLNNLPYRMVGIKGSSTVYDEGTDNAFIAYDVTFYYLVNGNLSLFSNNGLKVNRSAVKTKWNDVELTSSDTITLSTISCSSITTNIPIFENDEAGKALALEYLKTGKLPEEKYNDKIDIPRLVFEKGGLTFTISNATNEYFVEMQGRNYSVDDVELYKEDAMWKYKYSTVLYNDLTDWITVSDKVKSSGKFNLLELGKTSVANLNTKYPVDKRSYSGGKNALGNWLFGYDSALAQFKTLATTQGSAYLGTEIYIRFYYIDDNGDIQYGKWTHWYDNLASARGSTGSKLDDKNNIENGNHSDVGLTDDDKDKLEGGGNSRQDPDTKPITIEPGSGSETGLFKDFSVTNILTYFVSLIKTLLSATDTIAPFFNSIFGFLPSELRNVVYVTISAGCFCALIRFIFGKG